MCEPADFQISVMDFIAVILEEDMAIVAVSESFHIFKLTLFDSCERVWVTEFVFENFGTIEPVLSDCALNPDE